MEVSKVRRQIAYEAARLMYQRQESDLYRAKLRAARLVRQGWVRLTDLPSDTEVREQIRFLAQPASATQHASATKLDVPSASPGPSEASITAGHSAGTFPPGGTTEDRFHVYEFLLLPLEFVKQDPSSHPEGDALYHSLQVFEQARRALPYDEEFLTAALLHDVGKALDPRNHVESGVAQLDEWITPRTRWLIENHADGRELRRGTLGLRARRRLERHESYEELMLLVDCDLAGRRRGAPVPDVREAIDYLRDLHRQADDDDGLDHEALPNKK